MTLPTSPQPFSETPGSDVATNTTIQNIRTGVIAKGGTIDAPWGSTPKANQAREIQKYNIRTPQIFTSLNEGLNWLEGSGKCNSIFLRSEHSDDGKINARSGLLDTLEIKIHREAGSKIVSFSSNKSGKFVTRTEMELSCKKWIKSQTRKCEDNEYDISKLGYTTWEGISGDNYTIAHGGTTGTYCIYPIRVGEGVNKGARRVSRTESLTPTEKRLIDFYDQVRETGRFGISPIVEMQLQCSPSEGGGNRIEGDLFFLQGLMTDSGESSGWKLTRDKESDEREVFFVRGATPPEGIDCNLVIIPQGQYGVGAEKNGTNGYVCDAYGENSSLSSNELPILIEWITSQVGKKVLIICTERDRVRRYGTESFFQKMTEHTGISALHKSGITLISDNKDFYNYGSIKSQFLQYDETGRQVNDGPITVGVRICSDGKRAFIKIKE